MYIPLNGQDGQYAIDQMFMRDPKGPPFVTYQEIKKTIDGVLLDTRYASVGVALVTMPCAVDNTIIGTTCSLIVFTARKDAMNIGNMEQFVAVEHQVLDEYQDMHTLKSVPIRNGVIEDYPALPCICPGELEQAYRHRLNQIIASRIERESTFYLALKVQ